MTNKPEDYVRKKQNPYEKNKSIPSFSYKGAFILCLFAMVGSLIFPIAFSWLLSHKLLVLIGNTVITSFGVAYVRYFIETKRGFGKGFFRLWVLIGLAFFLLTFTWLFVNYQGTWYI